jgi:outer membrane protein OmpA-like peptidoglycan-associated protein
MSRTALAVALLFFFAADLAVAVRPADACGVKLALKRPKQRKSKNGPIDAGSKPIVAQRQARTPIAAGPTVVTPRRAIVEAKPTETVTPVPPTPEKETVTPQKEKVAVAATPKPVKKPVHRPKPVAKTPEPKVETTSEPKPTESVAAAPRNFDPATSVALGEEVFFKPDSAKIETTLQLDRAVNWLKVNKTVNAILEGHADPSGNPANLMSLSQKRAEAVRDYLVTNGIEASRLEVIGYGDTKAVGDHNSKNRRVFIHQKR